jgi:hypothetical protein
MISKIARIVFLSLVLAVFFVSSVKAAPDFDQIKANVEHSVQERKELKTDGDAKMVSPDSEKTTESEESLIEKETEVKIIWTMLGGRIKYWRVGSQFYLHLG